MIDTNYYYANLSIILSYIVLYFFFKLVGEDEDLGLYCTYIV